MASRSRAGGIGIQAFLNETEREVAGLDEASPKDLVTTVMERETSRLLNFTNSAMLAAEDILETGLVPELKTHSSYGPPPHVLIDIWLRPPDNYYMRFASKELLEHPGFRPELLIPSGSLSAAIKIEGSFTSSFASQGQPTFGVSFEVNCDQTLIAFKWLLQEWRRPIGQLLRGLPNLELDIRDPKGCRTKDPATLLEYHLAKPKPDEFNSNHFSLRSSFSANDVDQDVVVTFAVFLCLFDAVYRLTAERSDPDCLLRHYLKLMEHLPKAPFRITTIFPEE